jgi:hypothetical protein
VWLRVRGSGSTRLVLVGRFCGVGCSFRRFGVRGVSRGICSDRRFVGSRWGGS